MRTPSLILGYHGCDREVGESILLGEDHLRLSENDYDWLGSGVYFWENSPHRAADWAQTTQRHERPNKRRVKEAFVLGAVIDPGNCLDLLEAESIDLVEKAHESLLEMFTVAGLAPPKNSRVREELLLRRLDCAVINFLHERRAADSMPAFDTIRAAFFEGMPLYPGAGFQRRTHIQICVRNPRQILGYFKPLI